MKPRTLKIEEVGDFFHGKTHSRIRLNGQWLRAMGFPPGRQVEVSQTGPGLLTLRLLESTPPAK